MKLNVDTKREYNPQKKNIFLTLLANLFVSAFRTKISSFVPALIGFIFPTLLPIAHIVVLWYFWQVHCEIRAIFINSFYSKPRRLTLDSWTRDSVRARVGTRFLRRPTSRASLHTKTFTLTPQQTRSKYGCSLWLESYRCTNASNISPSSSYQGNYAAPWRSYFASRYSRIIMRGGRTWTISMMTSIPNGIIRRFLR